MKHIENRLHQDVEGTCSGRNGHIIAVQNMEKVSKGKVLPGLGLAEFEVNYHALVFKPYKGEVVDGIVSTVNKVIVRRPHLRSSDIRLTRAILSAWIFRRCRPAERVCFEPCRSTIFRQYD